MPYLISVPSKDDVTSIHYLKITEYAPEEFIGLLKQAYPSFESGETIFEDIIISGRDSTGYVTEIKLGNISLSGEEFARTLGLNSNHFYIEDYEGKARIICTGVAFTA